VGTKPPKPFWGVTKAEKDAYKATYKKLSTADKKKEDDKKKAALAEIARSKVTFWASNVLTMEEKIKVTSSSSSAKCSFAGGCAYKVEGVKGLTTSLRDLPLENYIKICDQKCKFIDKDLKAGTVTCTLPSISTTYSNKNFKIAKESENLKSGSYFGTVANPAMYFDDDLTVRPSDNGKGCNVGMKFRTGFVGMLSQVKYFISQIDFKPAFVNNLQF